MLIRVMEQDRRSLSRAARDVRGPSSDGEDSGQEKGVNLEASCTGSPMLVGHLRGRRNVHVKVNGAFAGYRFTRLFVCMSLCSKLACPRLWVRSGKTVEPS